MRQHCGGQVARHRRDRQSGAPPANGLDQVHHAVIGRVVGVPSRVRLPDRI